MGGSPPAHGLFFFFQAWLFEGVECQVGISGPTSGDDGRGKRHETGAALKQVVCMPRLLAGLTRCCARCLHVAMDTAGLFVCHYHAPSGKAIAARSAASSQSSLR